MNEFAHLLTAYGWAEEVPEHIAGLCSSDDRRIEAALFYLDGAIVHQGTPWTSTGPVAEAIAAILPDPSCEPVRVELVTFLGMVADSAYVGGTRAELVAAASPDGIDVDELVRRARAAQDADLGSDLSAGLYEDEMVADALFARSCLAVIDVAPALLAAVDPLRADSDPDVVEAADDTVQALRELIDEYA